MSKKKIARKTTTTKPSTKRTGALVDFDDHEVQRKIGALAVRRAREQAADEDRARLAAKYPTPWDGDGRFAEDADPLLVLRATFQSCQVDVDNDVLAEAVQRTLDELSVLELSLESNSTVIEAGRFVERVRNGLAAALWLHQRGSVAS